jgi:hypothetical protein
MSQALPKLGTTTRLVARALQLTPDQLTGAFRVATLDDLPQVLDLRRRVLGKALTWDDSAYLRWRYGFAGDGKDRGAYFVVVHEGRLLGMVGSERLSLWCDGERLTVPSLMDIMIEPTLDGTGLGVWLNLMLFDRFPIAIEIGANPNSLGLISRLYHRLPNRKQYIAPLHWRRVLGRRMKSRLLAATTLPLDVLYKGWRAVRLRGLFKTWTHRPIERFDATVDELFLNRIAPREIIIERDHAYLNWRLFGNPRVRYTVVGVYEGERLIGYWAAHLRQLPDGVRSVELVDWLIEENAGISGLGRLLEHAVRWAESERADYVSVTLLHSMSERLLGKLGFLRRSHEFNTVGVHCVDIERWPMFHQAASWYLTECNTDTDGISGPA